MTHNVYTTSDHHFGHSNIIDFTGRPFRDVKEMDEMFITYWNETVNPGDTVYHLGDFIMGQKERTLQYVPRLHGQIILQPGNHCAVWKGHSNKAAERWTPEYEKVGIQIEHGEMGVVWREFGGITFSMSHFPFAGDSYDEAKGRTDKFSAWRPERHSGWHLHGHTHSKERRNGRQIHIGVDAWDYRPVNIEQVIEIVKENPNAT